MGGVGCRGSMQRPEEIEILFLRVPYIYIYNIYIYTSVHIKRSETLIPLLRRPDKTRHNPRGRKAPPRQAEPAACGRRCA